MIDLIAKYYRALNKSLPQPRDGTGRQMAQSTWVLAAILTICAGLMALQALSNISQINSSAFGAYLMRTSGVMNMLYLTLGFTAACTVLFGMSVVPLKNMQKTGWRYMILGTFVWLISVVVALIICIVNGVPIGSTALSTIFVFGTIYYVINVEKAFDSEDKLTSTEEISSETEEMPATTKETESSKLSSAKNTDEPVTDEENNKKQTITEESSYKELATVESVDITKGESTPTTNAAEPKDKS